MPLQFRLHVTYIEHMSLVQKLTFVLPTYIVVILFLLFFPLRLMFYSLAASDLSIIIVKSTILYMNYVKTIDNTFEKLKKKLGFHDSQDRSLLQLLLKLM